MYPYPYIKECPGDINNFINSFPSPQMTSYLSAVFRVIAESTPEVFRSNEVTPLELAQVTARQCFLEGGVPLNGTLSFPKFRAWYSSPNAVGGSLLGRCGDTTVPLSLFWFFFLNSECIDAVAPNPTVCHECSPPSGETLKRHRIMQ